MGKHADRSPSFMYNLFGKSQAYMERTRKELWQETWNKKCFSV